MASLTLASWLPPLLLVAIAVAGAEMCRRLYRSRLTHTPHSSPIFDRVLRDCDLPARVTTPLAAIQTIAQALQMPEPLCQLLELATVVSLTWLCICALRGVTRAVVDMPPKSDRLEAGVRHLRTQMQWLERLGLVLIVLAGLAFSLMIFPSGRRFGSSVLASAGVASLMAGILVKSAFSNVIAGMQIAFVQPLALGDCLVVKGETGTVQVISAAYLVLRLDDSRQMCVPMQWFVDNPFVRISERSELAGVAATTEPARPAALRRARDAESVT